MTDPIAPRVLVMVPTYNEVGNLRIILKRLFDAASEVNVLVIDDASPDGTGALAEQVAKEDSRVSVMHRTGKLGLGSAYLAGFQWGIDNGYELLVEMDADGSHPPETLPKMISAMTPEHEELPGLVIGSRWMQGGSVVDWPKSREALSRGANLYTRVALGIKVKDATAGFRVYRASVLEDLDLADIDSKGYCFQIDMTLRVLAHGDSIREVPIVFRERQIGQSKMSGNIIVEAMVKVTQWGLQKRLGQISGRNKRSTVRQ
jgi:dolichol-phosphate mannosyltransferase